MSKAKNGAERMRTLNKRYKDAGFIQIKVPVHPKEAEAVRKYAAKKPLTRAIWMALKL